MKTVRSKSLVDGHWHIVVIEGNRYTHCEIEPLFDDLPSEALEGLLAAKEEMCRLHLQEILEDA